MFTGIIRAIGIVSEIQHLAGGIKFTVSAEDEFLLKVQKGASISVDGVCLTVTGFTSATASFDVVEETLNCTTLKLLTRGKKVNLERSACFGDEIGGHILSGHISDTVTTKTIDQTENNCKVSFDCGSQWMKYLFPKGYVALNGASLTLVDVDQEKSRFSVCLIPETLERTTFNALKIGDKVNLEIDAQTRAIVDTLNGCVKSSDPCAR